MCVCASFHHVAMKLFLYADAEQQELLKRRLCAKRETAFSKVRLLPRQTFPSASGFFLLRKTRRCVVSLQALRCLACSSAPLFGSSFSLPSKRFLRQCPFLRGEIAQPRQGEAAVVHPCFLCLLACLGLQTTKSPQRIDA